MEPWAPQASSQEALVPPLFAANEFGNDFTVPEEVAFSFSEIQVYYTFLSSTEVIQPQPFPTPASLFQHCHPTQAPGFHPTQYFASQQES